MICSKNNVKTKASKFLESSKFYRFQEDGEHENESCVFQTEESLYKEKAPTDFAETKRQKKRKKSGTKQTRQIQNMHL